MDDDVAVGAYGPEIPHGVNLAWRATFGGHWAKVVHMDDSRARSAVGLLEVEGADDTSPPVMFDAATPGDGIALVGIHHNPKPCTFEERRWIIWKLVADALGYAKTHGSFSKFRPKLPEKSTSVFGAPSGRDDIPPSIHHR